MANCGAYYPTEVSAGLQAHSDPLTPLNSYLPSPSPKLLQLMGSLPPILIPI